MILGNLPLGFSGIVSELMYGAKFDSTEQKQDVKTKLVSAVNEIIEGDEYLHLYFDTETSELFVKHNGNKVVIAIGK